MFIRFHVMYPLFLSDFNESGIFWANFSTNTQMSNFIKIHPVGAEFFHVDGRTGEQTLLFAILRMHPKFV